MKRTISLLALVASCFVLTGLAAAAVKLDGIKCPVSDKAVKEDQSVDHNGGKVYLCCGGCPDAFKKDVKKYTPKANHQLVATAQAKNSKCPFSGGDLNDEAELTIGGAKVKFCCNNCKGKAEKAKGDEQLSLVFGEDAWKKGDFKVSKK
ncbi:MAG: hypothetical protein NT069_04250 [Planctomycetota bacterium]|nr:hypothetical protein [Planctomycetota bacterium]